MINIASSYFFEDYDHALFYKLQFENKLQLHVVSHYKVIVFMKKDLQVGHITRLDSCNGRNLFCQAL